MLKDKAVNPPLWRWKELTSFDPYLRHYYSLSIWAQVDQPHATEWLHTPDFGELWPGGEGDDKKLGGDRGRKYTWKELVVEIWGEYN